MSERRSLTAALGRGLSLKAHPLATTFRPERSTTYGWLPQEPFAGAWQRNMECLPPHELTQFSAVFACTSRIANDVSKLEPRLMELKDGIWEPAPSTNPYWRPLVRPNSLQNRIQFFQWWMVCKLLRGNAYALKLRDGRGMVDRLIGLDPRRVTPMVTQQGDVYYQLQTDDLNRITMAVTVPASEIIHDRGVTLWHPLCGVSPVMACALSVTQGIQIQRNSSNFFENMSRPSGVLSGPGVIDDATAARLKKDWEDNFRSGRIGRLAVLGDDLKYQPMTVPAEDAQLIDQLKWTVEDTARAFAMPLYKIGAGPMPTSNNVAALNQQYHSDCLQAPIEALELALTEGLGLPPGMAVEFNLEGLLRMDQPTQYEMLTKAVGGSLMTPNEARGKANLPKAAGGDSIYQQQQYYSLAALAKRDASADPFGKQAASPAPAPAPEPAAAAPAPAPAPAPDPAPRAAPIDDATVTSIIERAIKAAVEAQRADLEAALARSMPAGASPAEPDDEVDQEEFLEALLELIDGTPAA